MSERKTVVKITSLLAALRIPFVGRRRAVASPVLKQMRRMEARHRNRR